MRNMSFTLTEKQLMADVDAKTVTRRLGWRTLKVGDHLQAVRKGMGLKPGEKMHRLCVIEVVRVTRERLDAITVDDCRREGFPGFMPYDFVSMFCREMQCDPEMDITRIEFRRLFKNTDPHRPIEIFDWAVAQPGGREP